MTPGPPTAGPLEIIMLQTRGLVLVCGLTCAASMTASVQGQDTLSNAAEAEFEMLGGPSSIPGREQGERTRGEPKAEEVTPAAVPVERDWFGGKPWFQWSKATGDWGGARTRLEESGLTINGSYTLDWSTVRGGVASEASTRALYDFNALLDLEKAFGLKGASIFANPYFTDGRGGSEDVGDFGGVSNIFSGQNIHQLGELWYQQWLFDKTLRIKAGKIDANAEFAFFTVAGDFLNGPSANPTTLYTTFPTYPNPATAVVAFVYPSDRVYIGAGFFDGSVAEGKPTGRLGPKSFFDGDAKFWIGEAGLTWSEFAGFGNGRALVGGWWSTADFTDFNGNDQEGTGGFYVMGEQQVMKREGAAEADAAKKGLFAVGSYGWGDGDVNPVEGHVLLGVVSQGTFGGRDGDSAGLMLNWLSFASGFASDDEVAFEAYYKVMLTPFVTVSPSLQYVTNPSGNSAVDDAWVPAVRLMVTF